MREALAAAGGAVTEGDGAIAALSCAYAEQIDAGGDLTKIGPLLLVCLESLLLSPRARASALQKGAQSGSAKSPLDELRARRARRGGAETVDAATP